MDNMASEKTDHPSFTQGMTLEDYMGRTVFEEPEAEESEEESLYASAAIARSRQGKHRNVPYNVREVNQESEEESLQRIQEEEAQDEFKDQTTKGTFRDSKPHQFKTQTQAHPMNATAYFGNSQERNNFRIKHVSQSPHKQQKNTMNPSMTLYGHKFSISKKKATDIPELVTFYGAKKPAYDASPEPKRKEERRQSNIRKKNQLNLDELLQHETRIKNNFSQKLYLKDIRVDGLKDKLQERKHRF